jgi:hemolysin activation/secretion protein
MKIFLLSVLGAVLFSLYLAAVSFAQAPSASQIQRSQEFLEKEEVLQEKLREKVFIREIQVEGATLIPAGRIKDTVASFKNKWLGKKDIGQIAELIRQLYYIYIEEGESKVTLKLSHEVQGSILKIRIEELKKTEKPQKGLTKNNF